MPKPISLRPGAKLEVLVISDDNGSNEESDTGFSNLAKDFDPTNKWQATVSGIIGLPDSKEAEGVCGIAAIGQEYITLAARFVWDLEHRLRFRSLLKALGALGYEFSDGIQHGELSEQSKSEINALLLETQRLLIEINTAQDGSEEIA